MQTLSRAEVREKLTDGRPLALIDVLPAAAFEEFHLPGAINVPLADGFDERIEAAVPDRGIRVIVYCSDSESQLSPTAAERIETLGYRNVYRYEAGKVDWRASGLPVER
jgi:rhodanese-related sulfurtransferase